MGRRFESAVITGASSGIGAALARRLLRSGTDVALLARREDRLREIAGEFPGGGGAGRAFVVPADVTDAASLVRAAALVDREMPAGIDLLVAGAGFALFGPFHEIPAEKYRRMFDTNVLGFIETVRVFLPAVRKRRGVIEGISSVAGRIAAPRMAAYCATKFAVHGFLDALRFEVAGDGVAVVELCPGATDTEFFSPEAPKDGVPESAKLLRLLSAEEVAALAEKAALARTPRLTHPPMAAALAWANDTLPGVARPIQKFIEKG